jgi:hypothetical protein
MDERSNRDNATLQKKACFRIVEKEEEKKTAPQKK